MLGLLSSYSAGVWTPLELEQLAGLLQTQEALAQGSLTWKDCLRMKADLFTA